MASSSPQTPLTRRAPTGTLITDVGQSTFYAKENPSRSVSVRLRPPRGTPTSSSLSSSCSVDGTLRQHASLPRDGRRFLSSAASDSRFPRLQDCAHFHYERVGLSRLQVSLYQGATASLVSSTECCLSDDNKCLANNSSDATSSALRWASRAVYHGVDEASGELFFTLSVSCNAKHWLIRRSWPHLLKFDKQLHTCCYDRGFSQLTPLTSLGAGRPDGGRETIEALKGPLSAYLARFSQIAGNLINCAPVLSWLELDNRGFHLVACASDGSAINTPAVAAVHVVKRYVPQLDDELALEVGDMISVIDMPAGEESMWWRGKKELEVGFFPGDCVQLISRDKIPHGTPDARRCITSLSHEQLPVLRKQSKFASFFRSFLSNRPTRRRLKESGILRERIFGCDLGEYLMNASSGGAEGVGLKVPAVLIHCAAFIEQYGIIDGIYRLSGIQSNIHRLRQEFDADHVPDLANSELYMQDIHSVASVLKLYFRELPNPLLTHQLYEQFVEAVQAAEELRLLKIHDVVSRLPPPHYRTLEYLMRHLARIASAAGRTGMTSKNLAIVWAPNLLRSSESESSLDALKGVSVCAIAVEYLVNYAELIFSSQMQTPALLSRSGMSGLSGRPKSLAVSNPAKLLTLDQARSVTRANPSEALPAFVEVGAGPHNLPQFHTVIELPKSRGKRRSRSVKDRKTSLTWRSILPGQRSQRKQVCSDRFLPLSLHSPPGASQLDSRLSSSRSVESVFQVARSAPDPLLLHSTLPEEPVSAPVHPPLTRSHSSPVSHSRSVSHESYFVRSGSLGLTRPRRIIDVVRTVRYDQCEGGLLVKLSFDEAVENAMQVEAGILNETLVAPATPVEVRAEVVEPVPVRQAARVTSKRPYRALSPLVLRRHRSWVAEESKQEKTAKGRFVKATTFPRQTSGIKRCLSASPKTGRRVEVDRDAVSLVLGKRASDSCSSSSSSGRKSFRRSAAEEDADSLVVVAAEAPVSVVVAVVHHQEQQQEQQDIEEACQAICDSFPGQMDAETTVTPSAPYLEDVEDAADVATTPEIAATFVWLDNAECSSLSSASSSSSLNLLDAEDADSKTEGEEESVVPTPSLFLFGLPSRPELCRTASVPVGNGADEATASEPVSVKRHSYFFGQSDADWVKTDSAEEKQAEQRILEAEEVRASYLFSQPIADLGASSSRVYTPVAASSLAETLEEIAKQLPSLQPLPDTEIPEMDDKTHREVENEAAEVSSNIQADGYRWMDSSSESLAAPTSDTDAALEPTAEPRSDGKTGEETTENVPDTPCSVRALRCRFEADRKPEPVPKAPTGVTLVRSPTRESLKSKLDALSDVYSSESTEADEPVAWHAPLPFSRKWSVPAPVPIKSEGSTGFRWPPEREEPKEEKERKEDGKENSDTVSLSEEGGTGAGSGGRKGKKVSQMCQIFQTPEAVAAPSRGGTLTARGTSGRAALSSSSVRLLPQYYSSV
ncbi:LOW QUALITY PROTEIN: uncharacterized protein LOC129590925 [Paramacrobiotus metropolitanus]|uniref:LOW QUALITY PROTEIN: uncharacterized protein LOC129590925 n=1 Tax=Paramacrobiotus metropolitanus TaxID=2943436 RepID=UPI0024459302|nr:LOW QUALITY PROTEIN: uncharacterized protein LOC129590925 [Paramacrobiotus metropolitanus]